MQRRLTIIFAVAGALIALAAGAAFFADRHGDSPERSLEALAAASQDGDWTEAQRYIDAKAVATSLAQSKVAAVGAEDSPLPDDGSSSSGGMGGGESQSGMLGRMATVYADNYVAAMRSSVEAGIEPGATGVAGVLVAGRAEKVEYVSDSEARVTIRIATEDGESADVFATMVRVDDHWQIIALESEAVLTESVE